MINKNISKPLNIASGRKINLTDLSKLIIKKYLILKRILLLKIYLIHVYSVILIYLEN